MSDFAKYTSAKCDAQSLENSLTDIKDNVSEQEIVFLPSVKTEQDELFAEFLDLLQKQSTGIEKKNQLEQNIGEISSKISILQERFATYEEILKRNNLKELKMAASIANENEKYQNHLTYHRLKMADMTNKFRKLHQCYDKMKLEYEIQIIEGENQVLLQKLETMKHKLEELKEDLQNIQENAHIDNLKLVLDSVKDKELLITYLQQTEKSLMDNIAKFQQDINN